MESYIMVYINDILYIIKSTLHSFIYITYLIKTPINKQ